MCQIKSGPLNIVHITLHNYLNSLTLLWYSLLFNLCFFLSKAPSGSLTADSIMTVSLKHVIVKFMEYYMGQRICRGVI